MQNPPGEEPETSLSVTPPKKWAAGVPAVVHALEYSLEQTSPRKSGVDLLTMNQVGGVDCPGCAWADPAPGQHPSLILGGYPRLQPGKDTRPRTGGAQRRSSLRLLGEGQVGRFWPSMYWRTMLSGAPPHDPAK
ncbi:hypothetical protein GCM10010448_07780 [Streptomyces glomeratus]|uniref:Uncharacterized protein n=1 Tax=Streptomyces glomeratus TaxID=284452 RepID=A0ABP6KZR8_9ACTN